MSDFIIGIGIVLNESGHVLIDQRTYDKSMGGLWEFPGGKKEIKESIQDTIAREVLEELGIVVRVGDKLIEFEYSYNKKMFYFIVHICKLISGTPKPIESLQIKWVKPINLINYSFPDANSKIIDALNEYLILNKDK